MVMHHIPKMGRHGAALARCPCGKRAEIFCHTDAAERCSPPEVMFTFEQNAITVRQKVSKSLDLHPHVREGGVCDTSHRITSCGSGVIGDQASDIRRLKVRSL